MQQLVRIGARRKLRVKESLKTKEKESILTTKIQFHHFQETEKTKSILKEKRGEEAKEKMVNTRRSNRARRKRAVLCKRAPKLTYFKRKKVQRGPLEEHQQEEEEPQQQEEHQQQEQDHLVTPPITTEDKVLFIGGAEVIPLDPGQIKPEVDHLTWLEPVSKPNYHFEIPQESREKFMDVAFILKAGLVSHLEESAHKLDVADMIQHANECFIRLRCLGLDYQTFHGEVSRLIKYYQDLKEANTKKNTLTYLRLVSDYKNSVVNADDAKEVLLRAESNLITAQTNNNLTRKKIEALTVIIGRLKMVEAMERDGLAALTAERDHCNEACSLAEHNVEETAARLEGIKEQCDVAEKEIRKSLDR